MLLTPKAIKLLGFVLQFCEDRELPCMITNVSKRFTQSISNTHPEGRAFDVRTKNWPDKDNNVKSCIIYLEERTDDIAALVKSGDKLIPRPAVYHNIGLGEHLHFQVRK